MLAPRFVVCNGTSEIVGVDVASWTPRRRLPAGEGVCNLAVTRGGKLLVATNQRGQSVSIVAVASVEGIGSEPGTLEVIDLATRRVASADVGRMARGVDVLPAPR